MGTSKVITLPVHKGDGSLQSEIIIKNVIVNIQGVPEKMKAIFISLFL